MKRKIKKVTEAGLNLAKEQSFRRYIFVGLSTVFIDFFLLALLREKFSGGLFSAVSIAYWFSVVYNFLLNRHWSFQAQEGMAHKQVAQYSLLLSFNYVVTLIVITSLHSFGVSEYLGKMIALGLTISWTYFIYKRIIFKP